MASAEVELLGKVASTIADRWEQHRNLQLETETLYRLLRLETNLNIMQLSFVLSTREDTKLNAKGLQLLIQSLETTVSEQVYAGSSDAARELRQDVIDCKSSMDEDEKEESDATQNVGLFHILLTTEGLILRLQHLAAAMLCCDDCEDDDNNEANKILVKKLELLKRNLSILNRRLIEIETKWPTGPKQQPCSLCCNLFGPY